MKIAFTGPDRSGKSELADWVAATFKGIEVSPITPESAARQLGFSSAELARTAHKPTYTFELKRESSREQAGKAAERSALYEESETYPSCKRLLHKTFVGSKIAWESVHTDFVTGDSMVELYRTSAALRLGRRAAAYRSSSAVMRGFTVIFMTRRRPLEEGPLAERGPPAHTQAESMYTQGCLYRMLGPSLYDELVVPLHSRVTSERKEFIAKVIRAKDRKLCTSRYREELADQIRASMDSPFDSTPLYQLAEKELRQLEVSIEGFKGGLVSRRTLMNATQTQER